MQQLRDTARGLLERGEVQLVIGYEAGPRGVRPAFIRDPQNVDALIFDPRCVHNLATYLSPRRAHLRAAGKPAVVVKGCDVRAVAGLVRESQIRREDVVLIGVRCGGVLPTATDARPLTAETLADRCVGCTVAEPQRVDVVVGAPAAPPAATARRAKRIAELAALPAAERFAYWTEAFARCVRCNACREVCPLCSCARCLADKSEPQWLERSPHARGNLAWHVTRALHLAGRCVDCGECERVCPAGIPLTLLQRKLADIVRERFDYSVSDDPAVATPVGTFRTDDSQEFIR